MRRIDPDGGGLGGWHEGLLDEALGLGVEGAIEGPLSGGMDVVSLAVVDLVWGHEAEARMVMVLVVPGEEAAAEVLGILNAAEALWELGLVFQSLFDYLASVSI